jgi:hypothetical protein
MAGDKRSFDWRVPAVWAALLAVSLVAHAHVEVINEASRQSDQFPAARLASKDRAIR